MNCECACREIANSQVRRLRCESGLARDEWGLESISSNQLVIVGNRNRGQARSHNSGDWQLFRMNDSWAVVCSTKIL